MANQGELRKIILINATNREYLAQRFRKIILINATNREYLAQRFGAEDDGVVSADFSVGYILVAPFNDEDVEYDLLTPGRFHELFAYTGNKLENGFLEVKRR